MDLKQQAADWAKRMAENMGRAQEDNDAYDDAKWEKERHASAMEDVEDSEEHHGEVHKAPREVMARDLKVGDKFKFTANSPTTNQVESILDRSGGRTRFRYREISAKGLPGDYSDTVILSNSETVYKVG
jgi:hypothetical protein